MTELESIPGYFKVSKDDAKSLIQSVITTDGFYLLRPTDDPRAICTICVSNKGKLMNYKLFQENQTRHYYIRDRKFPTIAALIHYYSQFPLNPEANTRLLYPVRDDQGDEYVALEPANPAPVFNRVQPSFTNSKPPSLPNKPRPGSGERMGMRPPVPESPRPGSGGAKPPFLEGRSGTGTRPPPGRRTERQNSNSESIDGIPGIHTNLSKCEVPLVLAAHSHCDGSYLVRPSASSKGQLTISLTCQSSILNFKINRDNDDGYYFVTPKKKYRTVKELLEAHRTVPLRSKARSGAKIFLLHPITSEAVKDVLDFVKQNEDLQKSASTTATPATPPPLPPPWKEYFDKNHQRPYYYNPQTKQTVWERPKAESHPAKSPQKFHTMSVRGGRLPNVPEEGTGFKPRHSFDFGSSSKPAISPNFSNRKGSDPSTSRPLPELPPKNPATSDHNFSNSPSLPSKEDSPRRLVPKLPPKEPEKVNQWQTPPSPKGGSNLPPLPPKEPANVPPLPDKVPPLPKKDPLPALPPKEPISVSQNGVNAPSLSNKSLPPLPPKDPSSSSVGNPARSLPPLPPKELPSQNGQKSSPPLKNRPTEYEETIPGITPLTPNTSKKINTPLPPPLPSFPEVTPPSPPPVGSGGPPPPPPAPPIPLEGIPAPPPPPPSISPSPSFNIQRREKQDNPPPDPSPAGGRPFSANDLLLQKTRLKKKEEEDYEPRQKTGSFLENTLSSAIELRLGSIRNAMDSDEDTDVEEVEDDDDWD